MSIHTWCLEASSTFKTIGEKLLLLDQKSAFLRFTDHVQDNEEVSGLLEDLREAIDDYQVRSPLGTCLDVDKASRWCNKLRFTNKDVD